LEHDCFLQISFLKSSISLDITQYIRFKVNWYFGGTSK
jgi:hypothetical protein